MLVHTACVDLKISSISSISNSGDTMKSLQRLLRFLFLLVFIQTLLNLTADAQYMTPYSMAALGPKGFAFLRVDSTGALITSPTSGGGTSDLAGYITPFAPMALDPNGNYSNIHVDATGALITSGGGGVTITTVAGLSAITGKVKGTTATVTDGNSVTDCTVGLGTNLVLCRYDGTVWSTYSSGTAAAGGSNTQFQFNSSGSLGGFADLTVGGSGHSLVLGASGIFDASAASLTGGFKIPSGASAAPLLDGVVSFNATTHLPAFGCNGSTCTPVMTTRTVAGHALSSDVTISASDVSLGSVTNAAQTLASVMPNTLPSAGYVPVGNAGGASYAPVALSGDCTLASTGAITCTKSSSTLFGTGAFATIANYLALVGGTMSGELSTVASTTTNAGLNIPQGAAPTTPVNGDVWNTSAGMYVRIAGATVGPLGTGGGGSGTVNNSTTATCLSYYVTTGTAVSCNTNATVDSSGNISVASVTTTGSSADTYTLIVAPSTPASGLAAWADSTDLRFHDKNASGVIGTTVVAQSSATSSNWVQYIGVDGVQHLTQPAFSNLSGYATVGQGGTNATTAAAALINLFPTATRAGDVIYCATYSSGCTSWALLAGNNSGTKYFSEDGSGAASWAASSGAGTVTSSSSAQYQLAVFSTATNIQGITFGAGTTLQGSATNPIATATPTFGVQGTTAGGLTIAGAGSTNGSIGLNGYTSGTATLTAPAVAGPATNALVSSNYISSPGHVLTGALPSSSTLGLLSYGTQGYSDSGMIESFQASTNNYIYNLIQNTNTGAAASACYITGNANTAASTNYGEFCMNGSGMTGTGVLNQPGYVTFDSYSVDMVIGTYTASSIHFVYNNGATDVLTINSNGLVVPAFSAAGIIVNNASGVLSSTTSPAIGTATGTSLSLGTDNSVAGMLTLANSAAAAHTIFTSSATTTNTIAGFATVPTNGRLISCVTSSTTCTLTDSSVVALNVVTAANSSSAAGNVSFSTGAGKVLSFDANLNWSTSLEYLAIGNQAVGNQLAPGNIVSLMDDKYNTTIQFNIQNKNTGVNVSGDYVITDGTNTSGYGDWGCNGASYAQPLYNSGGVNDCYLMSVGAASGNGNLLLTTGTANTSITGAIGGARAVDVIETLTNPAGIAPAWKLNNALPIIGANLTLTQAIRQTAQSFTITSVTCAGSTMTANGTITGGGSSAFANWAYTFSGATDTTTNAGMAGNNGTFIITSSTAATLVATNSFCATEATPPGGFAAASSANTTAYIGTITGGAPSTTYPNGVYAYIPTITVAGFTNGGNNGTTFVPISSTATVLAATNSGGVNETHAGTVQSTSVLNSPTATLATNYGSGAGTFGTDSWVIQDVIGSVALNPTSTLTFTHAGSSGASTVSFPAITVTGFSTAGIVHSSAAGVLSDSALVAAEIPAVATVVNSGSITVPAGNSVLVICTSTCAVPVPVPVVGYQLCAKNIAGGTTIITFNALGSSAMYPKSDDSGYGTAGTGTMVSTAVAGNKVCLIGRDSTHYELGAINASANWTVN